MALHKFDYNLRVPRWGNPN